MVVCQDSAGLLGSPPDLRLLPDFFDTMELIGTVVVATGSWYHVQTTEGIFPCQLSGKLRLLGQRTTTPVAIGDAVAVLPSTSASAGRITAIQPRRSALVRRPIIRPHVQHVIAANVDQSLLLVSANSLPEPLLWLVVDRFLVVSAVSDIQPLLVWNKIDLLSEQAQHALDIRWAYYNKLGYSTAQISALRSESTAVLLPHLIGRRTVLTGPSGTGKSTLLNTLVPEASQQTDAVSRNLKGRHTTRYACLFRQQLADGREFELIDTPGVQSLLNEPSPVHHLGQCFPEIKTRLAACKYYNCRHREEPQCAVRQAVEQDEIALHRYQNYLMLLTEQETGAAPPPSAPRTRRKKRR